MNFIENWQKNVDYFKLLELMASLSNLFSDNVIPFIHYRITENLFCKYYNAENLSRSDTAYDAKTENFGIGIKTFQLTNNQSIEKVAEFNSISKQLKNFHNEELAHKLAVARNERILLGQRLYSINDGCYHIIGRIEDALVVFNTPYPFINEKKISNIKDTGKSLQFFDGENEYSYNYSKSTLFKRFIVPNEKVQIPVTIIQDPYEVLKKLMITQNYNDKNENNNIHKIIETQVITNKHKQNKLGKNYVVLPLFSTLSKEHVVPIKSGLNQWNADGRPRSPDEVYIPIPAKVNTTYPNFFPDRDSNFNLHLPNGFIIKAKPCQQNRKALMSSPNSALGHWILRDVLQLKEGELVTMDLLNRMGFDSVIIYKDDSKNYRIDFCRTISYSEDMFGKCDYNN